MEDELKRPNYINCDGFLLPGAFSPEAFRSAVNYKPKPGQLFIVTYPKCGTTLMQQIMALIYSRGEPTKDFLKLEKNSPFLEMAGADAIDLMDAPGAIKCHLPFGMAPYSPHAKYIYVARNPKDCCVSFYYHTKNAEIFNFSDGTFDEFFELFVNGKTDYGDYFDHLLSWYEHKDDPNVFFVTYEDLITDKRNQITRIAKFMGQEHHKSLIDHPDILDNILKFSTLECLKNSLKDYISTRSQSFQEGEQLPSGVKHFHAYMLNNPDLALTKKISQPRKGIVGDWKNHFSAEQEERMNARIKEKTAGSNVMSLWKEY